MSGTRTAASKSMDGGEKVLEPAMRIKERPAPNSRPSRFQGPPGPWHHKALSKLSQPVASCHESGQTCSTYQQALSKD
jgi:hypothetical protein